MDPMLEQQAKNIVSRFLDLTNRGAIPEDEFNGIWNNTIVAIQCLNPSLPGDRVASEGGEILMALCKQVHPVNEKTGQPYCASKTAIVFGAQEAIAAICRLVAVGV